MILPICGFDAKNAVLCPKCEGKVESGELTKADVEASIILANTAKSNKEIEKFTLYSCKEFDGNFVLSLAKNDIMAIRQSRTLYRLIQDQFKGKIWLVEADENDKKFIEDLFSLPKSFQSMQFGYQVEFRRQKRSYQVNGHQSFQ